MVKNIPTGDQTIGHTIIQRNVSDRYRPILKVKDSESVSAVKKINWYQRIPRHSKVHLILEVTPCATLPLPQLPVMLAESQLQAFSVARRLVMFSDVVMT